MKFKLIMLGLSVVTLLSIQGSALAKTSTSSYFIHDSRVTAQGDFVYLYTTCDRQNGCLDHFTLGGQAYHSPAN